MSPSSMRFLPIFPNIQSDVQAGPGNLGRNEMKKNGGGVGCHTKRVKQRGTASNFSGITWER